MGGVLFLILFAPIFWLFVYASTPIHSPSIRIGSCRVVLLRTCYDMLLICYGYYTRGILISAHTLSLGVMTAQHPTESKQMRNCIGKLMRQSLAMTDYAMICNAMQWCKMQLIMNKYENNFTDYQAVTSRFQHCLLIN